VGKQLDFDGSAQRSATLVGKEGNELWISQLEARLLVMAMEWLDS
jgi:hypothetical protein